MMAPVAHPDIIPLHTLLQEVKTTLEIHIKQEEEFRPQIEEMIEIIHQFKGVFLFLKFILYIGTPLTVLGAWFKDHFK